MLKLPTLVWQVESVLKFAVDSNYCLGSPLQHSAGAEDSSLVIGAFVTVKS